MILTKPDHIQNFTTETLDRNTFTYYDTETDGVQPFNGSRLCGVSVRHGNTSVYVPFRHRQGENAPESCISTLLSPLQDPAKHSVWWNAPFDHHIITNEGITIRSRLWDAQVGNHLLNENELGDTFGFSLKPMGIKYIDPDAGRAEAEMLAKGIDKDRIYLADPVDVAEYAEQDVNLTEGLFLRAYEGLHKQGILHLFTESCDYVEALIQMEKEGALIDRPAVEVALANVEQNKAIALDALQSMVGIPDFNPNSHVQCKKLFGLEKEDSCDKEFLTLLGTPEATAVLQCRAFAKIAGSFYHPFLDFSVGDGRIHPGLKATGTGTGRISCVKPNLMALPREGDFFNVRSMVLAPPGYSIVSLDWSQAELRLLAHYTQDPNLMRAYLENIDIHQMTSDLLGIDRDWAKRMNFGTVYGLGVDGFMKQARITDRRKAERILELFHRTYPSVRVLYDHMQYKAKRQGYIQMWSGRRRRYAEDWECRKAMSGLIQGGVAEIMRVALTRIYKHYKYDDEVRPFLQVHDDVLAYVKDERVEEVALKMREFMTDFKFRVPLDVEIKIGKSWGKLQKVKRETA